MGTNSNGIEMPENLPHLGTMLSPYGYHTAQIGKLHFLNHSNRDHREPHPRYGFDTLIVSDEPGCYDDAYIKWVAQRDPSQVWNCRVSSAPACVGPRIEKQPRNTHEPYAFEGPEDMTHSAFVAEETVDFIRRRRSERWFCIAGFYAPHCPLNPPQRFLDMYDPADLPLPIKDENDPRFDLSDDDWRQVKAHYYALMTHIDDQIGRILAAIEEEGLLRETVVIHTSDHGEHLGDHGLVQKGPPGYDSCIHVPLVVSWPGHLKEDAKLTELIEAVDIAPTVLDLCGVQSPPFLQGRSFRALAETNGGDYEPRTSIYNEHRLPFRDSWKVVRTERLKYCVGHRYTGVTSWATEGHDFDERGTTELLFDLAEDPGELRNVAREARYASELSKMREELIRRWFDVENQCPRTTAAY